jgi:hypothetical protein
MILLEIQGIEYKSDSGHDPLRDLKGKEIVSSYRYGRSGGNRVLVDTKGIIYSLSNESIMDRHCCAYDAMSYMFCHKQVVSVTP